VSPWNAPQEGESNYQYWRFNIIFYRCSICQVVLFFHDLPLWYYTYMYCKPTCIHVQENFTRFVRTSLSQIFLVANHILFVVPYSLKQTRSRKLLSANQSTTKESQNKVAANKS
jgi:hypothetical protein